jgi:hypothetical protein
MAKDALKNLGPDQAKIKVEADLRKPAVAR